MSARSASRCELTDTYSPAAIDSAPATSPAIPAVTIAAPDAPGRGDAEHEARRRHDAVVGAEHRGAQPVGAVAEVDLGVQAAADTARPYGAMGGTPASSAPSAVP